MGSGSRFGGVCITAIVVHAQEFGVSRSNPRMPAYVNIFSLVSSNVN